MGGGVHDALRVLVIKGLKGVQNESMSQIFQISKLKSFDPRFTVGFKLPTWAAMGGGVER